MEAKQIVEMFKQKGLRATPQRIEVYKYLCETPTHPTVEEVYTSLAEYNPSFSKTTVYNSLETLELHGLITSVKIDNERIHYDANVNLHGHFLCEKCKTIYDFDIKEISFTGLDGFDISKRDVYYSGICPECK